MLRRIFGNARRPAIFLRANRTLLFATLALYAIALIGVINFSIQQVAHFTLTWDFQIYYQGFWQLGQGIANPYISDPGGYLYPNFLEVNFAILGHLLGQLTQSPVTLLIVQDVAAMTATLIAAFWCIDIIEERTAFSARTRLTLSVAALILCFANPWPYRVCAFDYHNWTMGGTFIVLTAWAAYRSDRVVALSGAVLTVLTGLVAATFVPALGLSLLIASKRSRVIGGGLVALGIAYQLISRHILTAASQGGGGVATALYAWIGKSSAKYGSVGILIDIIHNPVKVLLAFWGNRIDGYANLAPGGFLEILNPWVAIPWFLALTENLLATGKVSGFGAPGHQYAEVYALSAPGTIWIIAMLAARFPRALDSTRVTIVASLLAVNALVWGATFIPRISVDFMRTSEESSAALASILASTPPNAQTIVSQGVVGPFAGRKAAFRYDAPKHFPILTPLVRIVFAPTEGIETASSEQSLFAVQQMLHDPQATRLETDRSGEIWAFDYHAGAAREIMLGGIVPKFLRADLGKFNIPIDEDNPESVTFDATVAESDRIFSRNFSKSDTAIYTDASHDTPGFIIKKLYFRRPPGNYRFVLSGESSGPLDIEVRDATEDRSIVHTSATLTRNIPYRVAFAFANDGKPEDGYHGWGPFNVEWSPAPREHRIELRVFVPAHVSAAMRAVQFATIKDEKAPGG